MTRKEFLATLGLLAGTARLSTLASAFKDLPDQEQIMPVLFIGHGNPMNAIEDNEFSKAWKTIPQHLPKPKAILCISAHWQTSGTFITVAEKPKTIYDFYGFPKSLYEVKYDCPGAPDLANDIIHNIERTKVTGDKNWGLDHGTWSILAQMYPAADIPVIQLSINKKEGMFFHYELAKELGFLRRKGVLIVGSGNIVHNLRMAIFSPDAKPYDWALEFDEQVKELLLQENFTSLINYRKLGKAALLSVPTPDHYIPLLCCLGLKTKEETLTFPVVGMAFGSGSMRSIKIG